MHNVVKLGLKTAENGDRRAKPRIKTMVLIFGKENCPYTQRARQDYAARNVQFEYVDVKKNRADMDRMLELSGGVRRVPVIVEEGGKVTIGFGGT
jgi:glutaredoxin 3